MIADNHWNTASTLQLSRGQWRHLFEDIRAYTCAASLNHIDFISAWSQSQGNEVSTIIRDIHSQQGHEIGH